MKKDPIDSLFEEKLKNYSELPDEKVWKSIEQSLDRRKKSRRVVPLWWQVGGAAAVLAVLMYLFVPGTPGTEAGEDPLTNTGDTRNASPEVDSEPGLILIPPAPVESEVGSASDGISNTSSGNNLKSGNKAQSPNTVNPGLENRLADKEKRNDTPYSSQSTQVAASQEREDLERPETNEPVNAIREVTPLAENRPEQDDMQGRQANPVAADASENQSGLPSQPGEKEVAETSKKDEFTEGKSIYDAIAESEDQDDEVAENSAPRWSVGPKVAPVYFNSFGEGSPIHPNFVANSKSGNINLSYGLSLSYAISPKLSIRSGINKVEYGYDTNDITFSPTLAATSGKQLTTINYAITSRNLVVRNSSQAKLAQDVLEAEVSGEFAFRDGRMIQQFGYVEVPLELNLALVDTKLGLNLIGGLSSLFLVDNSVLLESNGDAMEMGEANNLNTLNFSTNIGLGVEYEVSPRIQLNLEPVFKYQLNTFSASAGTFNPYSIGVYSGINFRF